MPHNGPQRWQTWEGAQWSPQPAIAIRAITRVEAERHEAAAAAAWDAAALRGGGAALTLQGVPDPTHQGINGTFDPTQGRSAGRVFNLFQGRAPSRTCG